jgi:uncharacterized protein YjbI with pentapeptide repeats
LGQALEMLTYPEQPYPGANLAGSNLSGTNLNQDYMIGAILCNTTMPYGSLIYNSC